MGSARHNLSGGLRLAACAVVLLLAAPLRGQLRVVSEAVLDSLAHPAAAQGAEAMRFATTHLDAGTLGEDDTPPAYLFRWRNAGSTPLVVTRVETTCGCLIAEYDRRPVLPGGEATIRATYRPKGRPGAFQRRLFVYTQLSDKRPTAILELTGRVTPSADPSGRYPEAMGPLRLMRTIVRLDRGRMQSERIACINTGAKPLTLVSDPALTPRGLTLRTEPATLAPGAEGDLVISFDPAGASALPARVPLLIEGLDLAPSRRTISVEFGQTN